MKTRSSTITKLQIIC